MSSTSILERCLAIIEILAEAPEGMALGELSTRTGMPKSATHRMLSSLIESGFVAQSEHSRDYRMTMKLVTLGFRFLGETGMMRHCQSVLDQLGENVEELVRMTVVDGERLVWVAKAQGARSSLVVDPVMGRDVALHATATGKVWLASLNSEDALKLVLRDGFGTPHDHGPNVIQSVEELLGELEAVRTSGYGLAWEEADPGIGAIAVGIRASSEPNSPIVGTVSVAGPVFRISKDRLLECLPQIEHAAEQLCGVGSVLQYWHEGMRQDRSAG